MTHPRMKRGFCAPDEAGGTWRAWSPERGPPRGYFTWVSGTTSRPMSKIAHTHAGSLGVTRRPTEGLARSGTPRHSS